MNRILLACLTLVPVVGAASVSACSSDPPASVPTAADSGVERDSGGLTPDANSEEDATAPGDAADSSAACNYAVPVLNGSAPCGAQVIPAAINAMKGDGGADTDPDGGYFNGGAIEPGVYDLEYFQSSLAAAKASETLVFSADGKFTRTRRLDTGNGGAPISYRSGTYTVSEGSLRLTANCYYLNDLPADGGAQAGNNAVVYRATQNACDRKIEYGGGGVVLRLKRRK
jgi:hypothetical protein